jgi:hypothetical protein
MKTFRFGLLIAAALVSLSAREAAAQQSFESASSNFGSAELGAFGGFNWQNFYVYDRIADGYCSPQFAANYGYCAGVTSGKQAVYNGSGGNARISAANPFTFGGAWLSAAFTSNGNLSGDPRSNAATAVSISGFLGSTLLYHAVFGVTFQSPDFFLANWTGVNHVDFASLPNAGPSAQFTMDDVYLQAVPNPNAVPEPATITLVAISLAGLMAARRRARG